MDSYHHQPQLPDDPPMQWCEVNDIPVSPPVKSTAPHLDDWDLAWSLSLTEPTKLLRAEFILGRLDTPDLTLDSGSGSGSGYLSSTLRLDTPNLTLDSESGSGSGYSTLRLDTPDLTLESSRSGSGYSTFRLDTPDLTLDDSILTLERLDTPDLTLQSSRSGSGYSTLRLDTPDLTLESCRSGYSEIGFPNLPKFRCWVNSCRYAVSGFWTLKDQKSHYSDIHPELILRCSVVGCSSRDFFRESDLARHISRVHSAVSAKIPEPEVTEISDKYPYDGKLTIRANREENFGEETASWNNLYSEEKLASSGNSSQLLSVSTPSNSPSIPKAESPCSDPSVGFETESSWSEDTNWEGDSSTQDHEFPDIFNIADSVFFARDIQKSDTLIQPSLNLMKQALVDSIMKEFWVIFNQEWSANERKHNQGSPGSTSSSASYSNTANKSPNNKGDGKRGRQDEEDQNPDENGERNPKRQKGDVFPPKDFSDSMKFACPYRKHDPRKYCHRIRSWRSCALTPLETVSRVKGHLYRYHRIFQCQRCKELFKNPDELERHFLETIGCELNLAGLAEGITGNVEKKLRSRKKAHRDQSEMERWQEIYKILFPTEEVPSPYFEVIRDNIIRSPDAEELANYEEFSRRELPRFFRNALEAAVVDEAQPIEERLRSRLVGMIQDCQDRVFSAYRSQSVIETPLPSIVVATSPSRQPSLSHQSSLSLQSESSGKNPLESNTIGLLESCYERPPLQTVFQNPVIAIGAPKALGENSLSDSGYVSDLSGINVESPTIERTSTLRTIATNSPQTQQLQEGAPLQGGSDAELDSSQYLISQDEADPQIYMLESRDMPTQLFSADWLYQYDLGLDNFDFSDIDLFV